MSTSILNNSNILATFAKFLGEHPMIIHTPTEKEAEEYCTCMDKMGYRWLGTCMSYLQKTKFDQYRSDTCYYPKRGTYSSYEYFERETTSFTNDEMFGIPIVEWKDVKFAFNLDEVLKPETVEMTMDEICKALGKNVKIIK